MKLKFEDMKVMLDFLAEGAAKGLHKINGKEQFRWSDTVSKYAQANKYHISDLIESDVPHGNTTLTCRVFDINLEDKTLTAVHYMLAEQTVRPLVEEDVEALLEALSTEILCMLNFIEGAKMINDKQTIIRCRANKAFRQIFVNENN